MFQGTFVPNPNNHITPLKCISANPPLPYIFTWLCATSISDCVIAVSLITSIPEATTILISSPLFELILDSLSNGAPIAHLFINANHTWGLLGLTPLVSYTKTCDDRPEDALASICTQATGIGIPIPLPSLMAKKDTS